MSVFKTLVTKFKAARAKRIANELIALISAQMNTTLPVVLDFYKRSAHVAIDKTAEDSKPLTDFVAAFEALAAHYGPALNEVGQDFATELNAVNDNELVARYTKRLGAAIAALKEDAE